MSYGEFPPKSYDEEKAMAEAYHRANPPNVGYGLDARVRGPETPSPVVVSWSYVLDRMAGVSSRLQMVTGHVQVSATRLDGDYELAPVGPSQRTVTCLPEEIDRRLDEMTTALDLLETAAYKISRRFD
jgi:hypothetical protein